MKLILSILIAAAAVSPQSYFPELHDWQRPTPAQAGINEQKFEEAIAFARASESKATDRRSELPVRSTQS